MGMHDAIKKFNTQFAFEPVIENGARWEKHRRFIVAGMGGSHLAADLLKVWNPELNFAIHMDYGLPSLLQEDLRGFLVIASSYSGNTEETLDAYEEAGKRGFARAAISIGGKLLKRAKRDGIPYVQMPDIGIQPRSALGFSMRALLKFMGEEDALSQSRKLEETIDPGMWEENGKTLAEKLKGRIPVIYTSHKNFPIAYSWKIKFNETGKIPAFCNSLPELNHNEMTGFDVQDATRGLSKDFSFIILRDENDHPQVRKRMLALEGLLLDRGFPVIAFPLEGGNAFEKIFSSLVFADWTSYYLAAYYGVEAEQVPMVEEFKRLIA